MILRLLTRSAFKAFQQCGQRAVVVTWAVLSGTEPILAEDVISLTPAMTTLEFQGIAATQYEITSNHSLNAHVKKSASAIILPFVTPKHPQHLSLEWRMEGRIKTQSASDETKKSGDDFPLRIGFCLAGPAPLLPFFAPSWIKQVSGILKHPTSELRYYTLGAKHAPGERWRSPYSASIEHIALPNRAQPSGWLAVEQKLGLPKAATCLWLMADGDNSKSEFRIYVQKFRLQ